MFFGAARWRELSLVNELLRQFTKCLADAQTSKQFITSVTSKQRHPRQKTQGGKPQAPALLYDINCLTRLHDASAPNAWFG